MKIKTTYPYVHNRFKSLQWIPQYSTYYLCADSNLRWSINWSEEIILINLLVGKSLQNSLLLLFSFLYEGIDAEWIDYGGDWSEVSRSDWLKWKCYYMRRWSDSDGGNSTFLLTKNASSRNNRVDEIWQTCRPNSTAVSYSLSRNKSP